jgi:hypothetical protein
MPESISKNRPIAGTEGFARENAIFQDVIADLERHYLKRLGIAQGNQFPQPAVKDVLFHREAIAHIS